MSEVSFSNYLAQRVGTRMWCVAGRLGTRLKARGYETAITPARYRKLRLEWEREHYGAPLASLEKAAPDMLAALRLVDLCWKRTNQPSPAIHGPECLGDDEHEAWAAVQKAIAKATGETPPC